MIDPLAFVLRFIFDFWWLLLPLLLLQITWEKFKTNQRSEYRKKMNWFFLELKFPPGITRTPRAMEEVFNALHAIAPDVEEDLNWWSLNVKGFVPQSYALLIIAHDGKLKFYLRFPQELKDFVKTRFYSQYPELQFEETEDPLKILPPVIPNSLFDCELFDARLQKEDGYPIKTYVTIENLPKEQQLDPITTFSEGATQISNKEWLIFQIMILPTTPDNSIHGKKWIERGTKLINKLIGKTEIKEPSILDEVEEFIINLLLAPFRTPVWKTTEKKEEKEFSIQKLTPGERKVIEAIQTKLSKLGYWTNWRIAYIASKEIFSLKLPAIVSLTNSILRNFSTEDLNGFSLIPLTRLQKEITLPLFILKSLHYDDFLKNKTVKLPKKIANKLKAKNLEEGYILNSEELASIFHPPMEFVSPTGIEKVPFREFPPSIFS